MSKINCATIAFLALGLAGSLGSPAVKAADPIPPLNAKGDVYKTEGENDPLIYDSAVGAKKIIMLYLDFPDQEMSIDTKERGRQVLGGSDFEELFRAQSYGKLSFSIEHVHGWRRLSKKVGEYSSKTTEAHRDLFVESSKLRGMQRARRIFARSGAPTCCRLSAWGHAVPSHD